MSMTKYAGVGPGMAALNEMKLTFQVPVEGAPVLDAKYRKSSAAYPGDLHQFELRRIIQNLADQVSELAAQNVDLRQRLASFERLLLGYNMAVVDEHGELQRPTTGFWQKTA